MKPIQEKYKKYSLRDPRKAPMNEEIPRSIKKKASIRRGLSAPDDPDAVPVRLLPHAGGRHRLRHAAWLWVHDLSAPDPWHLLPIAIVVTMFLMQRMTPQAGMDPAQQKMMNIMMPVMLGYISLNLAPAFACTGPWAT